MGILAASHRSRQRAGSHPPSPRCPLLPGSCCHKPELCPSVAFASLRRSQGMVLVLQDSLHAEIDSAAWWALIQSICSKYEQNDVFVFFFFWQNKSIFQWVFLLRFMSYIIFCKISICQEWFQKEKNSILASSYYSIPKRDVHQCCQTFHPPLPCIPLWVWNFSKR